MPNPASIILSSTKLIQLLLLLLFKHGGDAVRACQQFLQERTGLRCPGQLISRVK